MPIKFYKALKTLKGQAPSGNTDTNYELVGETITEDEKNSINSKIEAAKNYNVLSNRPSINNVVLEGNKTLAQLGINIAQTVTNNANQIPSAAAVYNFVGSSGASAIQTGVEFNTGKTLDGKPIYGKFIKIVMTKSTDLLEFGYSLYNLPNIIKLLTVDGGFTYFENSGGQLYTYYFPESFTISAGFSEGTLYTTINGQLFLEDNVLVGRVYFKNTVNIKEAYFDGFIYYLK